MKFRKKLNQLKEQRKRRVRSIISGTAERPRLSIFRSNRNIAAQLIDDVQGKTLLSVTSKELKTNAKKTDIAKEVGKLITEKARKKGIEKAVSDRGQYRYHGRVKALVEGAREAGLKI